MPATCAIHGPAGQDAAGTLRSKGRNGAEIQRFTRYPAGERSGQLERGGLELRVVQRLRLTANLDDAGGRCAGRSGKGRRGAVLKGANGEAAARLAESGERVGG